jgi:cell division protein FtsA
LAVKDLVLEPLASSYAVLEESERDLGVDMIDFGGGTTDIALFEDGAIRHAQVLAVGGQLVTRDIALGLSIPLEQAENLKIKYALAHNSLLIEDSPITLPGFGSRPETQVPRSQLNQIVQYRIQEIFEFVRDEIIKMMGPSYHQKLPAGIIVTGGGALVQGTDRLAAEVLGFPVQVRGPRGVAGLNTLVESPIYATGIGLLLYGLKSGEGAEDFRGDESKIFEKILKRMKRWWDEFFS